MILGLELVKNSGFDSEDHWDVNVPWSIGASALNSSSALVGTTSQIIGISSGGKYRIEWYDLSSTTPTYDVLLGGVDAGSPSTGLNNNEVIVGGSGNITFAATGIAPTFINAISDVSVRLVATNIEEVLFVLLSTDTELSGLVESRIYPEVVPQDTALPAIYYTQIAGPRQHTLSSSDNMVPSRWQFTVVGTTYAELRTISDAIRIRLDSFSGTVGDVVVQCSHMIDENDLTDIRPGTDKLRRYTKAIDYNIWYNE